LSRIQNLEWRSKRFLVVANYDRQRTAGLTDADLIEAMTTAYGPRQPLPTARAAGRSPLSPRNGYSDDEQVIARWEDAESTVTLLRTRYPAAVSLVVLSKRLSGLAQSAEREAARLDRVEAPEREAARLQKEADETRVSAEKARPANKAIFKP
jgi:hypothetical protein